MSAVRCAVLAVSGACKRRLTAQLYCNWDAGGGGLYHFVFRRWCYRLCIWLAKGILFCSSCIVAMLLFPWRMLYRFILQPCGRFWKKIYRERQEFACEEENIIENENNFST